VSTADAPEEDTRTRGAKKFDAFMNGDNATGEPILGRVAAAALGVTEPTIGHWRSGNYSPDYYTRWVIQAWTGDKLKADWWETDADKRRIQYANKLKPYGTEVRSRVVASKGE
jgi:hypothetical protein